MYLWMEEYVFVFIIAVITLSIIVMLRALWVLLLEVILINLPAVLPNNTLIVVAISIIQVALALMVMYTFFKATDVNYTLALEKTHKKRPHLTKHGSGTRFSFWKTD